VNFLSEVSYEEVVGQWLQREYLNAVRERRCPTGYDAIVFNPDYENHHENQERLILMEYRCRLLLLLPRDTKWFKAEIAREDLCSLRLINEETWNILSNRTGAIDQASENYLDWSQNPGSIPMIPNPQVRQWLTDLLAAIGRFRSQAGKTNQDLTLILVGTSKEGHFTVLEGNRTSMGLYLHHIVDNPESVYPEHHAYLGISPAMSHYLWHHPA
jgi:hypothetical protein